MRDCITYLKGDATRPDVDGMKIVAHICNDIGAWGAGFVLAVSRRWPEPERMYRATCPSKLALGGVQYVQVEPDVVVANMVAQRGIRRTGGTPPIRYGELALCLRKVACKAKELGASVCMPRIGCGLAGGSWEKVEEIIREAFTFDDCIIRVFVYDL